jgi:hypothetical protein
MFSRQDELAAVNAAIRENVQLMMLKRNGNSFEAPSSSRPISPSADLNRQRGGVYRCLVRL